LLFINLYLRFGVTAKDSNVGIRVMSRTYLEMLPLDKMKDLKIPNALITAHSFYINKNKTAISPILMRMNIETGRDGEQWGNGTDIRSMFKLLKGAFSCFMEVNIRFNKIIKN